MGDDLFVVNADGTGLRKLRTQLWIRSFALSPGGRQIAFDAFEGDTTTDWEICVINSDGTGLRQLTYNTREDIDPTWSPDGRRIVFTSRRDRNFEIYVMNADGSDQTNISRSPAWDEAPAWQPAD